MLIKRLSKIAAKELKNTQGVAPQWKEKMNLVEEAYGENEVEKDFLDWIDEIRNNPPQYPISTYLKIVDERFRTSERAAVEDDPNIVRLSAQAFEITARTPSQIDVAGALEKYSVEQVEQAFKEYVSGLDEKELKYATRQFYAYGGLEAVMEVQKKKKEQAVPDAVVQGVMVQDQTDRQKKIQEELDELVKAEKWAQEHKDEI